MKLNIVILYENRIGKEIIYQAVKVLKAIADRFDHEFQFEEAVVGNDAVHNSGDPLPSPTLLLCKKSDAVLFGSNGDSKNYYSSSKVKSMSGLLKLREELGLYANFQPVKTFETLVDRSPLKAENITGTDMVIISGLKREFNIGENSTDEDGRLDSDHCNYSVEEIERIAHLAFKAAQFREKKVTLIDRTNVLERSRQWRKTVTELSKQYKDVELNFLFIENAALQMVLNPKQFDIILTEFDFCDILSNEASAITGSIGLLESASIGDENALFEPIQGPYCKVAKKGNANPVASILSAAMLLNHFGLAQEAAVVRKAVEVSLQLKVSTKDITPENYYSTEKVGDFIEGIISDSENYIIKRENLIFGQMTII